jgi:DNA-binding NarL/FixJ family response regulator/signal transduction histidine kinase
MTVDTADLTPFGADDGAARRAASLAEITQAIATSLEVSRIFEEVSRLARHVLPHNSLIILLNQAESDGLADARLAVALCHLCFPARSAIEVGQSWPPTSFSFGPTLLANQSVVVDDLAVTAVQYPGNRLLLESGRSALVVPIHALSRVLGGLVLLSWTPGRYSSEDVLMAEPFAGLLAIALEHQRLNQQSRALAVAEERNRLAREIHDTLAQSLTGIIINLESLRPFDAARSHAEVELLAETETLARGALEEARRSVLNLHPTPLEHHSLHDALAQELAGLARRTGLATQFYVNGEQRPLAPDQAVALFRVAQEAFQNIYKHAAARHVMLGLAFEAEAVVLTVEDDGIGFVPEARTPDEHGGFGLLSMAARTRSLGGDFQVTSRPGHGAVVRATLPYVRPIAVVLAGEMQRTPTPPDRPIRVLIVDNHAIARQGIRRILDGQVDIQIVGEAEDGLAAVEQTAQLLPDVVLLDLQLPRLSGIEALPRLRAAHSGVEVVMLTMFDQDEQVFASLKAGARGYVLKDAAPASILAAVRAASHGETSLPPTLATHVVERFAVLAQREVDPDALTERELEIVACMARGTPYKEIATQLNVTTHTVQYHVTNILQKLHVGNRGEAVAVAVQRGLLKQAK